MKVFYTDGSASPNPGPGGWTVIDAETKTPVLSGSEKDTTNIRMEGTALIEAIKLAGNEPLEIHTDSEFWINTITKWAPTWAANGWRKKNGEIKNLDLVQELYDLYNSHDVKLIWVRGHVGTELNEIADKSANEARKNRL
jgi:ribonuclease HI